MRFDRTYYNCELLTVDCTLPTLVLKPLRIVLPEIDAARLYPGSLGRMVKPGKELQGRYSSSVLTLRVELLGYGLSGPAQNSRGFCFDPVRRIGSNWFEDSPSRHRGAVAQLGERCNRTAEVRGSIPLSSTAKIQRCPPPLGRT